MSSDEYQVRNECKYTRKSYKKSGRRTSCGEALCIDNNKEAGHCGPREETPRCCPREETPRCCPREETPRCCPREETSHCCRSEDTTHGCPRAELNMPNSSFEDTEGEVANILHKKCPVITLAQQQLERLLSETDDVLCDNTRCCRSVYDFICLCKDGLKARNKSLCFLLTLVTLTFLFGVLFGAASCGEKFRKFNSPILTCIDNFFITDSHVHKKEFRGIV